MRVGYSMWGFLGAGVVDTPDGSRSYRRAVVEGLVDSSHDVVFLQQDRDRFEAGKSIPGFRWDAGLPDLHLLMLEWRWPLPGRNDTPCGSPGHTCDLHRQAQLLDHYTAEHGLPTLIWDLDRQMRADDPLRGMPNVTIADFALRQEPDVVTLPCPVPDRLLDAADPAVLAGLDRPTALVYVGNQYDRDPAFERYFAPAAAQVPHEVAGKWTAVERWPHVRFTGRVGYLAVEAIHRRSLSTMLLMPDRYASVGAVSSRWFESITAGCLPLVPQEVYSVDVFAPPELQIGSAADAIERIAWLRGIQGSAEHAAVIQQCLERLEPFRASRQAVSLNELLHTITSRSGSRPAPALGQDPSLPGLRSWAC
jgi:hypothetical protein